MNKRHLHELKINNKFVSLMKNGTKRFEVRKIDKNFSIGDYIQFVDTITNEKTILVKIIDKNIYKREILSVEFNEFISPLDQISYNHKIDLDTVDFCFDNYHDEKELILYEIEVFSSIKKCHICSAIDYTEAREKLTEEEFDLLEYEDKLAELEECSFCGRKVCSSCSEELDEGYQIACDKCKESWTLYDCDKCVVEADECPFNRIYGYCYECLDYTEGDENDI